MNLEDAKKGINRNVIYRPFKDCDESQLEYGVITSTNEKFVFVRYGADINSKATRPEDIIFK